jgi:hypothetical protein
MFFLMVLNFEQTTEVRLTAKSGDAVVVHQNLAECLATVR